MNYFITGATGFIGSELCARLIKKKKASDKIYCLVRKVPDFKKSLLALRLNQNSLELSETSCEFVLGDLSKPEELKQVLEQFIAEKAPKDLKVLHLGAMIAAAKSDLKFQKKINVSSTELLVDWANQHAERILYLSSVAAWGLTFTEKSRTEIDYEKFSSLSRWIPYFSTKRKAHEKFLKKVQIPYKVFCPSIVHGSLESFKNSRAHIPAILSGRLRWAPGGGANFTSLNQVVTALINALEEKAPMKNGVQLLVGSNIKHREYFQKIVSFSKEKSKIPLKTLPSFVLYLALPLFVVMRLFSLRAKNLEALILGSSCFYFKSQSAQNPCLDFEKSFTQGISERI